MANRYSGIRRAALIAAVALLCVFADPATRTAAATTCPVQRIHLSSSANAPAPSQGITFTRDDSVSLRVDPTAGGATFWSLSNGLLGSRHRFSGSDDDAQERIDVSTPITSTKLTLGSVSCALTFVTLRSQSPATSGLKMVALLVDGGPSWGPAVLGTLELGNFVTLADTTAAFDGSHLSLVGHVHIGSGVTSTKLVRLIAGPTGLHPASSEPIALAFPPSTTQGILPTLEVTSLAIDPYGILKFKSRLHLQHSTPAVHCTAADEARARAVNLEFYALYRRPRVAAQPGEAESEYIDLTSTSATDPAAAYAPFGGILTAKDVDIDWCYPRMRNGPHLDAHISKLTVDFRDSAAAAPAPATHTYFALAGTYTIPPTAKTFIGSSAPAAKLGLTGFRIGDDHIPHGIFAFTTSDGGASAQLPTIALPAIPGLVLGKTVTGYFDENDNAILTLDATLDVALPTSTAAATAASAERSLLRDVRLSDIRATVANGSAITDPRTWTFDVSQAKIVLGASETSAGAGQTGSLFGHALSRCASDTLAQLDVAAELTSEPQLRLCAGVHIQAGAAATDDDVAYALVGISDCQQAATAVTGCGTHRFVVHDLGIQLPADRQATIQLGAGSLRLTSLWAVYAPHAIASDKNSFTQAVGEDVSERLGCADVAIEGHADLQALDLPVTLDQKVVAPDGRPTIRLGFGLGESCDYFLLKGALPIRFSEKADVLLTSLVLGGSTQQNPLTHTRSVYAHVAGSVTSGNITGIFSDLGFRTLTERERNAGNLANARPCLSDKTYHETRFGDVCVVTDVNWNLSAAITAAQNANQIVDGLKSLGTGILGFLLGRK